MTPDELKSIPTGEFVVMKTGSHPMKTRLRLFLDWGITFGEPYQPPGHGQRKVYYAGRQELETAIQNRYWTGPEHKQGAEQESEMQSRPSQKGRPAQRHTGDAKQEAQPNSPLVTSFGFEKKQDTPPASPDGR